jgi:hypothetical protein
MPYSRRALQLKREVIALLTEEELANINAGNFDAATLQHQACEAISLQPITGCSPTCGPGCTARSAITDELGDR